MTQINPLDTKDPSHCRPPPSPNLAEASWNPRRLHLLLHPLATFLSLKHAPWAPRCLTKMPVVSIALDLCDLFLLSRGLYWHGCVHEPWVKWDSIFWLAVWLIVQSSEPESKKSSQRPKRFAMCESLLQMDSMQRTSVYISNVQSVCRQHFLQFGHNGKLQFRAKGSFILDLPRKHLDKALCTIRSDMPEIKISTLATWILHCTESPSIFGDSAWTGTELVRQPPKPLSCLKSMQLLQWGLWVIIQCIQIHHFWSCPNGLTFRPWTNPKVQLGSRVWSLLLQGPRDIW